MEYYDEVEMDQALKNYSGRLPHDDEDDRDFDEIETEGFASTQRTELAASGPSLDKRRSVSDSGSAGGACCFAGAGSVLPLCRALHAYVVAATAAAICRWTIRRVH